MEANWLNQKDIDRQKWDELVSQTKNPSIYVYSFYLDSVAIDWDAFIAIDFSFAIPIGIVKKGGLLRAYPPLFQRYIEPIGKVEKIDFEAFERSLFTRYSMGEVHSKSMILPNIPAEQYIHQALTQPQFKLRTQAKRMIARFQKTEHEISEENIDTKELLNLITKELSKKLKLYVSKDVNYLFKVVEEAEKQGLLYKVGVFSKGKLMGGLIGLKYNNKLLYLKGTAIHDLQKEGVMYSLMNHFIQYGFSHNLSIDFGGSRNEGVRFFFTRFNGSDTEYYKYSWNNAPLYYKLLFKLYNQIKKRK